MARVFVGYMLVSKDTGKPQHGTRRFKVWTTKSEGGQNLVDRYPNKYAMAEVYAEVPDEPAPLV